MYIYIYIYIGIVQGGIECGNEYLPGIFTRLTNPNILDFVKRESGMSESDCNRLFL
jgi:hypothetical protein